MVQSSALSTEIKNHNGAISNQQSARLKTTKMLKVLRFLFPNERWNPDKLQQEARDKVYSFPHGRIRYIGQPEGKGSEHLWEIVVNEQWVKRLFEANASAEAELVVQSEVYPKIWNGMTLRSRAEEVIAEALQQHGVLFLANARCRLLNRSGQSETWETDFLVFYHGKVRILEVDGAAYHQYPGNDYKRDRVFAREGVPSSRFIAAECFANPDEVVKEFLELFEFN
jgi:very-short-patch-repair endonuclease